MKMSGIRIYQGTIQSDGRLTDVASPHEKEEILSSDIRFEKDSLFINVIWRNRGSSIRYIDRTNVERKGPPTDRCERGPTD